MNTSDIKSKQVELWQACDNHCVFCYLGEDNRHTPDELKISVLKQVIDILNDESTFKEYNNMSYIGGEFFQGQLHNPEVKKLFMEVMRKTAELLRNGTLKSTWIACTLTRADQSDLYETMDLFKDIPSDGVTGVWLTTSYDTMGRFHIEQARINWENNIKKLHETYPNIKFNTTMILTQDLIEKHLANKFSFTEFMDKYHTNLFFKQPSPGFIKNKGIREGIPFAEERVPNMFPKRETFLRFLSKVCRESPYLYDKLFNIKYRADELNRNFNDPKLQMVQITRHKDSKQEYDRVPLAPCGHLIEYCTYVDSDACMLCDKERIKESLS